MLILLAAWPVPAQMPKQGGWLTLRLREDVPYGFSIHESPTISTMWPAMPCFSNLVLFDPAKPTHSIDGITSMLQEAHLPPALAYGVYVGEVVAPILLLLGQWARAAGLLVACDMVMAIALTKSGQVFAIAERGGGLVIELESLYLLGGVVIALIGAGSWSVSRGRGLWN